MENDDDEDDDNGDGPAIYAEYERLIDSPDEILRI
jgi:hypothetical protein